MTPSEKRRFIRDLCDGLRDTILASVPFMPKEWDGHELREYIAEKAAANRSQAMKGKRAKEFRNTIAVNMGL
jgi:hypothetical protein